jgi:hypothetical protein
MVASATFVAQAQVGHPLRGSWSGYWGPSDADQRRMLLVLDWADNKISGTINPGPRGVAIRRASLDVSNWMLTIEADMPVEGAAGGTANFVATAKVENLGSWTNRRISGEYRLGDETGKLLLTIN